MVKVFMAKRSQEREVIRERKKAGERQRIDVKKMRERRGERVGLESKRVSITEFGGLEPIPVDPSEWRVIEIRGTKYIGPTQKMGAYGLTRNKTPAVFGVWYFRDAGEGGQNDDLGLEESVAQRLYDNAE